MVVVIALFDEMSHDMSLQMIDINERDFQAARQPLSKAHAHKQRAHEPRATGESDGRQLFFRNTRTLNGLVHYRYHILLMCSAGQLRDHTAIGAVNLLRGRHVAQQHTIAKHCCRGVVTR